MLDDMTQLRKGVTEFCLLALLEREPGHGYELVARLARTRALALSENTVYPALARLKTRGWARSRPEVSAGGPARKVLELTPSGRARLGEWRAAWARLARDVADMTDGAGTESEITSQSNVASERRTTHES
ncbi:MAG: PadR family transcriptional regulator [Phycisphaerae bacterium]|nr:PadR family transcriptional regulator [Phycisphaerae bacterium]